MKKFELFFAAVLVPLDYLMLVLAAFSAYFIRFESFKQGIGFWGLLRPATSIIPFRDYIFLSFVIPFLWLLIFALSGLYKIGRKKFTEELMTIVTACSAGIMATVVLIFLRREFFASRFIVLAVWFLAILFVSFGRFFVRILKKFFRRAGFGLIKALIIGEEKIGNQLVKSFTRQPSLGYKVVKQVSAADQNLENLVVDLAAKDALDCVIAADPIIGREKILELLALCEENHLGFKYPADAFATYLPNFSYDAIVGIPLVEVKRSRLDGWGRIFKRIFDIFGSLILIILTSPLMLLTAMAIKLDSRGPIFWNRLDDGSAAKRVGENGKPFHYFKFRSMRPNHHLMRYNELAALNERANTPLVKIKNDPRVTRVGRFIRRFSLDELPELFLVLIGKMSLAGPRPHLPEEVARYQPHQKKILNIKPGITGLAQISGRADLDFEDEVRLDSYYIENWSLGLDLYILVKTPFVVLSRRGAY